MQAVEDAINAGIDRFSFDDRDRVKTAQKELRISDSLAKEILDTVARKAFTGFVTRSRSQRDRLEAAKELKKLVFFSNIVVAPLLEDVQVRVVMTFGGQTGIKERNHCGTHKPLPIAFYTFLSFAPRSFLPISWYFPCPTAGLGR